MAKTKKVASPTGKPSAKRPEIKNFEAGGGAGGGKRKSAYTAPIAEKKKKPSAKKPSRKPSPGMLGTGAAAKAGRALAGRGKQINKALKKAGA